jgi:hypothetical protein
VYGMSLRGKPVWGKGCMARVEQQSRACEKTREYGLRVRARYSEYDGRLQAIFGGVSGLNSLLDASNR